jgi:hypothetical protein
MSDFVDPSDVELKWWSEIRSEIRQRIEQRDRYSIQLTISLAAIYAFAFSDHGSLRMLLAAPVASLYYTVLILYSYAIHDIGARYLRERLEPALSQRTVSNEPGWENYYSRQERPGIRRHFFLWSHWTVLLVSWLVAIIDAVSRRDDPWVEVVMGCVLVIASAILATPDFWRGPRAKHKRETTT